jgi:hypothetical protein
MSECEPVGELPWAADCCPCVGKLRTVLPLDVGIRDGARVGDELTAAVSPRPPIPLVQIEPARAEGYTCDATVWALAFVQALISVAPRQVNPNSPIRDVFIAERLFAWRQVRIDYGEKSNEDLLFHYGFVIPGNPEDMLMLYAPLPPESQYVHPLALETLAIRLGAPAATDSPGSTLGPGCRRNSQLVSA